MASLIAGRSVASTAFRRCCRPQYLGTQARLAVSQSAGRSFASQARSLEKKYTNEHEWVELGDDGKSGTIGISQYAAKALGEVVYVELPQTDMEVTKGDAIGAVESVKSASDIMTPVSGKIVEANGALENKPSTINDSPEGDGWLAKIEVSDASELEGLMDATAYKAFTEE